MAKRAKSDFHSLRDLSGSQLPGDSDHFRSCDPSPLGCPHLAYRGRHIDPEWWATCCPPPYPSRELRHRIRRAAAGQRHSVSLLPD